MLVFSQQNLLKIGGDCHKDLIQRKKIVLRGIEGRTSEKVSIVSVVGVL